MPILADSTPTLFQQLVFGEDPGLVVRLLYSVIICATVFAGLVSVVAMFCIWWERKVAGHMQSRIGPNRVGPYGILQSLADGVKLLVKEDLAPGVADHFLFRMAPYLAFAPAFSAFLHLPFGPAMSLEPRA